MAGDIKLDRCACGSGVVATVAIGPKPTAWAVSVLQHGGAVSPGSSVLSVSLVDGGLLQLSARTPQAVAERWERIRSGLVDGPSAEAVAAELARAAAAVKACVHEGPALVRFAVLVGLKVDPQTAGFWSRMKTAGQA